jgi:putative endonuclease
MCGEQMNLDEAIESVNPMPAAYVLRGAVGAYLYKGSCRNLVERMRDHRAGRVARTKNRRPLSLVYYEVFDTYGDARRRELSFKTGRGREVINARVVEWQTHQTSRLGGSACGGKISWMTG